MVGRKRLPFRVEGKTVDLRRPRLSDAPTITRLLQDRTVSRFTFVPHPYTEKDARRFLEMVREGFRDRSNFAYAIELRKSRTLVGMIGFHNRSRVHNNIEIGYWVAKDVRGGGICTEAVKLGLRIAFRSLGVRRVHAHTFLDNPASARVLEKAGFSYEGTLRRAARHRGRYRDIRMYAIVKDDPLPRF